jgi:hypothetical protein
MRRPKLGFGSFVPSVSTTNVAWVREFGCESATRSDYRLQAHCRDRLAAVPEATEFRCSWTQCEYHYAHSLGKKVIAYVCALNLSKPDFQEVGDETERARKRRFQAAHRNRVKSGKFDELLSLTCIGLATNPLITLKRCCRQLGPPLARYIVMTLVDG